MVCCDNPRTRRLLCQLYNTLKNPTCCLSLRYISKKKAWLHFSWMKMNQWKTFTSSQIMSVKPMQLTEALLVIGLNEWLCQKDDKASSLVCHTLAVVPELSLLLLHCAVVSIYMDWCCIAHCSSLHHWPFAVIPVLVYGCEIHKEIREVANRLSYLWLPCLWLFYTIWHLVEIEQGEHTNFSNYKTKTEFNNCKFTIQIRLLQFNKLKLLKWMNNF